MLAGVGAVALAAALPAPSAIDTLTDAVAREWVRECDQVNDACTVLHYRGLTRQALTYIGAGEHPPNPVAMVGDVWLNTTDDTYWVCTEATIAPADMPKLWPREVVLYARTWARLMQ